MTTEGPATRPPGAGVRVEGLGLATVSVAVLGVAAAGLGLLVQGTPGAVGSLVGVVMVVVFFCFGALTVNLVASWAPQVSMVVALMTYTLQVLLLAVALVAVARSGLVPDTLDARWLGGTVMVATVVWMGALLVGALRSGETSGAGPVAP